MTRRVWVAAIAAVLALVTAVGCVEPPPPPVAALQMNPDGTNFLDMPWPSDTRTNPDGTLDLAGLPGVELLPGETPTFLRSLLPGLIGDIGESVDGFGVNTAAYFDFDLAVDPATLPGAAASTLPGSPVLLMNLDDPGERVPVISDFQMLGDRNRPSDLLTVLPYPGHPLRESTRYAVAITRGLRLRSGQGILPAPLIDELDSPWDASTGVSQQEWDNLRSQRDEVRTLLESTTNWSAGDMIGFTVFTTQDVRGDMEAVAAAVDAAAPSPVVVDQIGPCSTDPRAGGTQTAAVLGTVELTRWQTGTYPYYDDGGEIVVGPGGQAVPQGSFDAEFMAKVPCGDAPPQGWPLLTFVDGTGGSYIIGDVAIPVDHEGYLIASISPVYGLGRGITITPLMQSLGITSQSDAAQFTFYNFLNADAARTNTIQQAAENLQFMKAMHGLTLDGTLIGTTGTVGVDPNLEVASGQSQGAQTLPMVAHSASGLDAVVSSAGGGGLFHNISHDVYNRSFLGGMTGDAAVLDELNPIVQVAQTMLEGGDGINFPSTTNYLQYHGRSDSIEYGRHHVGATDMQIWYQDPPTSLYGVPSLDPPKVTLPATGNVAGSTRVAVELRGGHYVAYDQIPVTKSFLADVAAGSVPTLTNGPFVYGPHSSIILGGRWDDPPRIFAR